MTRKKYTGDVKEPEVGGYQVINILSKEIIIDNRTKQDCDTIAFAHNHQYCKPNFPNKFFTRKIKTHGITN